MNPTLQRAVTSFYNLVYEAQAFATTMARIDTAETEHYAGRIEGLNWVLDRCQELEDMDTNLTPTTLQRVLSEVKSDLDHELSVQRREKGRRADGRLQLPAPGARGADPSGRCRADGRGADADRCSAGCRRGRRGAGHHVRRAAGLGLVHAGS